MSRKRKIQVSSMKPDHPHWNGFAFPVDPVAPVADAPVAPVAEKGPPKKRGRGKQALVNEDAEDGAEADPGPLRKELTSVSGLLVAWRKLRDDGLSEVFEKEVLLGIQLSIENRRYLYLSQFRADVKAKLVLRPGATDHATRAAAKILKNLRQDLKVARLT